VGRTGKIGRKLLAAGQQRSASPVFDEVLLQRTPSPVRRGASPVLDAEFQQLDTDDFPEQPDGVVAAKLSEYVEAGNNRALNNLLSRYRTPRELTSEDVATAIDVALSKGNSWAVDRLLVLDLLDAEGYEELLYSAAANNRLDLVRLALANSATFLDVALGSAAGGGHLELVKWFWNYAKSQDINDHDPGAFENAIEDILQQGAAGGHLDIMRWAIAQGAKDNIERAGLRAFDANPDLLPIVMNEFGLTNYNRIMSTAANKGRRDIVDKMLALGADNYNSAASSAAQNPQSVDIVYRMIELGADNFNGIMFNAAGAGSEELVDDMIQRGANDYNTAAFNALNRKHYDLGRKMLAEIGDLQQRDVSGLKRLAESNPRVQEVLNEFNIR